MNVRSGHGDKGHQNADGKVFAYGAYFAPWSFAELQKEFQYNCFFRLEELLERLDKRIREGSPAVQAAAEIHRNDVMPYFYRHVAGDRGIQRYNSHSVCLCCLSKPPEHPLPCGHVLCTPCIKIYGFKRNDLEIIMDSCPLEARSKGFVYPWTIHFKPESAGVRVLCLDG